jgi:hypothetical protein
MFHGLLPWVTQARGRRRSSIDTRPIAGGEHLRAHLAAFHGFLQADGYSGFGPLYKTANGQPATVSEVVCWAHVRRQFYDIHVVSNAPIAGETLQRIGQLFDIERAAMGRSPEQRRLLRQSSARPSSTISRRSSTPRSPRSQAAAIWPKQSAMPARAGPRSRAISMTALWRSATMPPSAQSARS